MAQTNWQKLVANQSRAETLELGTKTIRVEVHEFAGTLRLDIREMWKPNGVLAPTTRGVSVSYGHAEQLLQALIRIIRNDTTGISPDEGSEEHGSGTPDDY